jgi:hypothetical protein
MPLNVRVIENPDYWRKRAEEARTRSEEVRDAIAKALILESADSYERMANAYQRGEGSSVCCPPDTQQAKNGGRRRG